MSSSTLFQNQPAALHRLERTTEPLGATLPRFKIRGADFSSLLPIVAAGLLLLGFGIVAVPLAVHDLPLLLG